eukprot:4348927-Lingulodinium_polyedra.AAC.1
MPSTAAPGMARLWQRQGGKARTEGQPGQELGRETGRTSELKPLAGIQHACTSGRDDRQATRPPQASVTARRPGLATT